MIKKNRPISHITLLNQLDRAKGLDHSKTYDNMTTATCFMEFISLAEREKLIDILSKINFFSLTMDGCTDECYWTGNYILLIRTCVQGKTTTRFVCIAIGEPQSTSSEDLFAFVNEKLNENYLTNHMSK